MIDETMTTDEGGERSDPIVEVRTGVISKWNDVRKEGAIYISFSSREIRFTEFNVKRSDRPLIQKLADVRFPVTYEIGQTGRPIAWRIEGEGVIEIVGGGTEEDEPGR